MAKTTVKFNVARKFTTKLPRVRVAPKHGCGGCKQSKPCKGCGGH